MTGTADIEGERLGLAIAIVGPIVLEGVSLARALAGLGHGVSAFAGADEAYEGLRSRRGDIDLLILALAAPPADPYGTLAWLRTKGLVVDVPVWAVAGGGLPVPSDVELARHGLDRAFPSDVSAEEPALRVRELLRVHADERRRSARVRVRADVRLGGLGRPLVAELVDLSATGVFVRSERTLAPGKRVSLAVELEDGADERLVLTGRVVRVQVAAEEVRGLVLEPGMGIELDLPEDEARERLERYLHGSGPS